jgi:chromosome segregation ATPase
MPGLMELADLMRAQTEVLATLPRTLVELNRSVLRLTETLASARETVASTQRLTERLNHVVDELEEPVLALRPGLERLAVVLDDPVISTVPDTLRRLQDEAVPLLVELRETQSRVSVVATFAEEATARLANLPGAGLLRQRRRPAGDPSSPSGPAAPSPPADLPTGPDEDDQPD